MELLDANSYYGFKTTSPKVLIFKDGKPFYFRTNRDGVLFFNLPAGKYDILCGEIKPCTPVIYPTLSLDKRNHYSDIKKLQIIVSPNKNKASVDLKNRVAILDPSFLRQPEFVIKYVIGHEYAHNLYRGLGQESEISCDKLACDTMLKIGFNPNQCIAGIRLAISNHPKALIRKKIILTELNKIKNGIITGD